MGAHFTPFMFYAFCCLWRCYGENHGWKTFSFDNSLAPTCLSLCNQCFTHIPFCPDEAGCALRDDFLFSRRTREPGLALVDISKQPFCAWAWEDVSYKVSYFVLFKVPDVMLHNWYVLTHSFDSYLLTYASTDSLESQSSLPKLQLNGIW